MAIAALNLNTDSGRGEVCGAAWLSRSVDAVLRDSASGSAIGASPLASGIWNAVGAMLVAEKRDMGSIVKFAAPSGKVFEFALHPALLLGLFVVLPR